MDECGAYTGVFRYRPHLFWLARKKKNEYPISNTEFPMSGCLVLSLLVLGFKFVESLRGWFNGLLTCVRSDSVVAMCGGSPITTPSSRGTRDLFNQHRAAIPLKT